MRTKPDSRRSQRVRLCSECGCVDRRTSPLSQLSGGGVSGGGSMRLSVGIWSQFARCLRRHSSRTWGVVCQCDELYEVSLSSLRSGCVWWLLYLDWMCYGFRLHSGLPLRRFRVVAVLSACAPRTGNAVSVIGGVRIDRCEAMSTHTELLCRAGLLDRRQ